MEIPAKLPFSKRRLPPRVVISYIFDYLIIIACAIGFSILNKVEPFHQHFSLNNISIQYPYAVHERVPMAYALCISAAFPLVLIILYTLLIDGLFSHHKPQDVASGKRKLRGPHRLKDRLWELNCGILGLLLAQGLAFVITQALKTACGKPRPDLIDRCQPRVGSKDLFPGLSNSTICTGDPALLTDGFRSWPSVSNSLLCWSRLHIALVRRKAAHYGQSR
ncbi:Phosphatidic acid phosphatase type 2/haloperoxidase [Penicillium camemberti]|uniref:Phosphatidic acid phosphatase type 2/haloperoxidase n=1 Tax=Penicillium camemberti (strain FM 013) TaxID=1429867 RepID=A0A0G4NTD4_PENC3|nr:Phosphatidic acid phosphatase type 2/haloperoxidase [Penicillium camemberti]